MNNGTVTRTSPLDNPDLARTLEQIQPPRRTLAESLSQTLSREYGLSVERKADAIILQAAGRAFEIQIHNAGVFKAICEEPRVQFAVNYLWKHHDVDALFVDFKSVLIHRGPAAPSLSTFATGYLDFVRQIVELREALIYLTGLMLGLDAEMQA